MRIEHAFGNILKQLRIEKGLSQERLAELCDLDRTFISLLERGLRKPTINTLFKIAKALETTPTGIISKLEAFLGGTNENS